jgi:hypothetical protein
MPSAQWPKLGPFTYLAPSCYFGALLIVTLTGVSIPFVMAFVADPPAGYPFAVAAIHDLPRLACLASAEACGIALVALSCLTPAGTLKSCALQV